MKFKKVVDEITLSSVGQEKRKEINLKKRANPKNITDTGFPDLSGTSDTSGFGNACLGPNVKGVKNDGKPTI